MMRALRSYNKFLLFTLIVISGCGHYRLTKVRVGEKPTDIIWNKKPRPEKAKIFVHYAVGDSTDRVVKIDNIEIVNDEYFTADTFFYDYEDVGGIIYKQDRDKLVSKLSRIEGAAEEEDRNELNRLHIYTSIEELTFEDGRLRVSNEEVREVHDMIFKNSPQTPVLILSILLGGIAGAVLIVFLLYLAIKAIFEDITSDAGCYVATMIYGSYESPEVLVLRRFRDRFLKKTMVGRGFILFYYQYSPKFVEKHKDKPIMKRFIKWNLDRFVSFLRWCYR